MANNFDQWYSCNQKTYHNIWQAFYDNKDAKENYVDYHIDQELIGVLKNFKRPNTSPIYLQKLMISQLKKLRKTYNEVRFLYSGGTDSYTILKLAIENDIYIDETITHMVSLTDNNRTNIEYLFGLNYAQNYVGKNIGKITIINPTLDDYYYLDNNNWLSNPNYVKGNPVYIRPCYFNQYLPSTQNKSSITIIGYEKPQLFKENDQLYWTLLDYPISECMDMPDLYFFFLDKNNPELVVGQNFALIDSLPKITDGYFNFQTLNLNTPINLIEKIGLYSTNKRYIDKGLLGKKMFDTSIKNQRTIKELKKLGRTDILDKIKKTCNKVYNDLKHIPYSIEYQHGFVKSVGRFSQKIPIYQDSFGS